MTVFSALVTAHETERLSLRQRLAGDAEATLELLSEHDGGTDMTLEAVRERLTTQETTSRDAGIGALTIIRRSDGANLGYCALIVGRASLEEPEIAYELLRRYHGQGYATEAAQALLDAAFATGRRRIWSTTRPGNVPSLRVLEKLGFRRDRVTADERGEIIWLVRET